MKDLLIKAKVSAKIPIVLKRLERKHENGEPVDLVSEIIKKTRLVWNSRWEDDVGSEKVRGYIRIPPSCLQEIIQTQPSFVGRVCDPPCRIDFMVNQQLAAQHAPPMTVSPGTSLDVSVDVRAA